MNRDGIYLFIALSVVVFTAIGFFIFWRFHFEANLQLHQESIEVLIDRIQETRSELEDLRDEATKWN